MSVCGLWLCVCEGVCVTDTETEKKRDREEKTLEDNSKDIPYDSSCSRMKSLLLITAAGWDELGTQRDGDAGVRTVWFH